MNTPASLCFDTTDADGLRAVLAFHLPTIRATVAGVLRRHGRPNEDHGELLSDVCVHLLEDDCAVLRKFRGASTLRTYLHTVTRRVLLDRRVRDWGKWRPSASARALGPVARQLEQLIKREQLTVQEALGVLVHAPSAPLDYTAAVALYGRLQVKPRTRHVPLGDVAAHVPDRPRRDPVRSIDLRRRAAEVSRVLEQALASLLPEERRLIRLRYRDGWSLVDIARAVACTQKELYRRHERTLARLRSALRRAGVDAEDVRTLIGETVVEMGEVFDPADTAA